MSKYSLSFNEIIDYKFLNETELLQLTYTELKQLYSKIEYCKNIIIGSPKVSSRIEREKFVDTLDNYQKIIRNLFQHDKYKQEFITSTTLLNTRLEIEKYYIANN